MQDNNFGILQSIMKSYELEKVEPNNYSPLALAFIGDSVYDLVVKSVVTLHGNCQANKLNAKAVGYVKAISQAEVVDMLLEQGIFTEEEEKIYRRGKNSKPGNFAKNAPRAAYLKATGLEAVIGYLYLKGNTDRVIELMKLGMQKIDSI